MPARSRIPDPATGALAAFAYDLRQLGEGKTPIPVIAERSSVSRAALYAAISGTRLPSRRTVATLVRWWAGDPSAEYKTDDSRIANPVWDWALLLPQDHPSRETISNWERRYRSLVKELDERRVHKPAAAPVRITEPPEQRKFIDELLTLIDSTGMLDYQWLLFGELNHKVTSYIAGAYLPEKRNLTRIVRICLKAQGYELDPDILDDDLDDDEGWALLAKTMESLGELVAEARIARARERRKARGG
ncbi:hypothetical protein [Streptomyces sp. NPDC056323]|uniref:hypothetical protein n=1 Tax=Streptomyces sp. NPDC056323 TaxID=3345784 RepID=UPI0035DCC849